LFDLSRDPHELTNCIDQPRYRDRLARLRQLVHAGWDAEATERQVLESQRRRRLILEALSAGPPRPWDAQPDFHAHEQYVRKDDAQATSVRLRYPRAGDGP
jgi:choline-sulfatase